MEPPFKIIENYCGSIREFTVTRSRRMGPKRYAADGYYEAYGKRGAMFIVWDVKGDWSEIWIAREGTWNYREIQNFTIMGIE